MKKIIVLSSIALIGLLTIYKLFFYIDPPAGCFITFVPSMSLEFNTGNIKQGIRILKQADPEEYRNLCRNVRTINANISCGGWQGGCYSTLKRKTIYLATSHNDFLGWTAAVIAHETCHAMQHAENRDLSEVECYQVGYDVLRQIIRY
jgi:hypothetical protein